MLFARRRGVATPPLLATLLLCIACDPESWFSSEVVGEPQIAEPDKPEGPESAVEPMPGPVATDEHEPYSLTPRADGSWSYDEPSAGFTAVVHADGGVSFRDRVAPAGNPLDEGLRFSGPADWEKRAIGDVPHRSEKLAFLRWTEAQRDALSAESARQQLAKAEDRLRNELDLLWSDSGRASVDRRKLIFERWDECLEAPRTAQGAGLDDARVAAGARARLAIELFIRERIPQGSADAYTSEELAALNGGRHSKAPFDPYAAGE